MSLTPALETLESKSNIQTGKPIGWCILSPESVSRRKFLATSAACAVGGAALGFAGGYYSVPVREVPKEIVKEVTKEITVSGVKPPRSEMKIAYGPFPNIAPQSKYMEENGIWDKYAEKYNVDISIEYTYDDFPLWAAQKVDVGVFSPLEMARLRGGGEVGQDEPPWDIVQFGRDLTSATNFSLVRPDSPYQSIADLRGKKVCIPGWDSMTALAATVMTKATYNLDLRKDFEIKIAPWGTLEELLLRGDVEGIITEGWFALPYLYSKELRMLGPSVSKTWYEKYGYWGITVTGPTVWKDWFVKNPYAVLAYLEAYDEGKQVMSQPDKAVQIFGSYRDIIGESITDDMIKWMVKEVFTQPFSAIYPTAYLDADNIIGEVQFLKVAAQLGFMKEKGFDGLWQLVSKPLQT